MRPTLTIENIGTKTVEEKFQNNVLRPILKMCNDELITELRNLPLVYKEQFMMMNKEDSQKLILQLLKSKPKIYSSFNLIILEKLSFDEKVVFLKHKKELNKRLKEMLAQRLGGNLSKAGIG